MRPQMSVQNKQIKLSAAMMLTSHGNQLTALLLLLCSVSSVYGFCNTCRYSAWNCSVGKTSVGSSSSSSASSVTVNPVAVSMPACDATGRIQLDDFFCDESDCQCAEPKQCVSLILGCERVFQMKARKRCLSNETIVQRFDKCARHSKLTESKSTNLASDWVLYRQPTRCASNDCHAIASFHSCGVVNCGYLILAWKDEEISKDNDKENQSLHFLVEGSRTTDLQAGVFHFRMPLKSTSESRCNDIVSDVLPRETADCYALQTRNSRNGSCNGLYFQLDTTSMWSQERREFGSLSWPIWLLVVGSICVAVSAVLFVSIAYVRIRRQEQDEANLILLQRGGTQSDAESNGEPLTVDPSGDRDQDSQREMEKDLALRKRAASPGCAEARQQK